MSHQSFIPILRNALLTISKYIRFVLPISIQEAPVARWRREQLLSEGCQFSLSIFDIFIDITPIK